MPSACARTCAVCSRRSASTCHFFEEVAYGSLRDFCQEVADCDGTVYFSGVGKSGFVAQKVSATMVSTGAKSAWLDPTDALRGDVGVLRANDVLVLFSKSGASDELARFRLVPLARANRARASSVASDKCGKLANDADTHVTLPLDASTPVRPRAGHGRRDQMLFGDTCAVAARAREKRTMPRTHAPPPPTNARIPKRELKACVDERRKPKARETTRKPRPERYDRRRSRAARRSFWWTFWCASRAGATGAFWWRTGNVVVRRSSWSACSRTAICGGGWVPRKSHGRRALPAAARARRRCRAIAQPTP